MTRPPTKLTAQQRTVLRALQDGLPLVDRPYAAVAVALGLSEDRLLEIVRSLCRSGAVRRIGASLAHRRLGVRGNVLCAWRVPARKVARAARTMAARREVSHCYERETPPDWPYNLFTMIHGRSVAECLRLVDALSRETGLTDYVVMQSTREFKKTWSRV